MAVRLAGSVDIALYRLSIALLYALHPHMSKNPLDLSRQGVTACKE